METTKTPNTKTKITLIISAIIIAIISIFYAVKVYSDPEAVWSRHKAEQEAKIAQNERKIASLRAERVELQRQDESLSGAINRLKAENASIQACLENGILQCEKSPQYGIIPQASARWVSWDTGRDIQILPEVNGNGTPVSAEPWRDEIQCAIGTGSHDVRHLAKHYPWVAGWKNNNPSGLSLGSKALEKAFDDAGIRWFVWTPRPKNEGSHYYGFPDLENGMKAKLLIIRRSYRNHTISSYLTKWWTDEIPTTLSRTRTIWSLSDSELIQLIKPQIRKESWKDFADFIFKNVLLCH